MGYLPRRATLKTFLHKSDPADIKRYSYWFSGAMEMFTACFSLLQSIPPQTWTWLPCSENHCRSEREGWKSSKLNCIKNCASLKCLQWLEPDWGRKRGNWGRISDVGSCFETLQVWWSKSGSSTSSQLFFHQEMSLKLRGIWPSYLQSDVRLLLQPLWSPHAATWTLHCVLSLVAAPSGFCVSTSPSHWWLC